MEGHPICLSVPAKATFARPVRMLAANLAVIASFGVDEVEDLRMAAEEGFVYACATQPSEVKITFYVGAGEVRMEFALGGAPTSDDPSLSYATLLLSAVCDSFELSEDCMTLSKVGGQHA